jgi:hypothetical protein
MRIGFPLRIAYKFSDNSANDRDEKKNFWLYEDELWIELEPR